jgi:hypothetical protein
MVGGNWGVRIKGRPTTKDAVTNIYFYAGLEGLGELQLSTEFRKDVLRPSSKVTDERDSRTKLL